MSHAYRVKDRDDIEVSKRLNYLKLTNKNKYKQELKKKKLAPKKNKEYTDDSIVVIDIVNASDEAQLRINAILLSNAQGEVVLYQDIDDYEKANEYLESINDNWIKL